MENDKLFHDWAVGYLKQKLSRSYNDVKINLEGEKKNEFEGHYPDIILGNHGLVLAVMEVETEKSVTPERAEEWKKLATLGAKLIVMVPKASKAKVVELLWKVRLADKAAVGTYEFNVSMP
ncbi:MAG: hypothetical protein HY809_06745 [Nitrospirae bacterium]|nr:hypothetical protein [Nitrospirota bacterium]